MTTRLFDAGVAMGVMTALICVGAATVTAQTAESRYAAAKSREDRVRGEIALVAPTAPASARTPMITEARAVIAAYEALVRAHRASGYSDNALFNAASLADTLHERFGLTTDRDTALRLYKRLTTEYPTAPLAKQSAASIVRLEEIAAARAPIAPPASTAAASPPVAVDGGRARLLAIDRVILPDLVRVTLSLDREIAYHEETLTGPARVFFDFKGVDASPALKDAVLRYPTDIVRQIRIGRHPNTTRVVLDLEGVGRHSVYTLYNPFRIVVDAESPAAVAKAAAPLGAGPVAAKPTAPITTASTAAARPTLSPTIPAGPPSVIKEPLVVPSVVPVAEAPAPPAPVAAVAPDAAGAPAPSAPGSPAVNAAGGFSIARQLGLGVSRIVIDPGHGGHDPGAQARGLHEADVTLDVALRLEKLFENEPGIEVLLTRRTDVYIPLEERTAMANRENADLFLSIHANTSRSSTARGVETYFLSFAGSADAEAVAARENSSHGGEMRNLPDMIRAITLNNKLDESRDLAGMVQEALVTRLRRSSKAIQNRGVKKAPFVVLIGAEMPSVLAEVSFMSNRQELQLLKTASYKQRIAEALHAAVLRYRRSLKGAAAAAAQ